MLEVGWYYLRRGWPGLATGWLGGSLAESAGEVRTQGLPAVRGGLQCGHPRLLLDTRHSLHNPGQQHIRLNHSESEIHQIADTSSLMP